MSFAVSGVPTGATASAPNVTIPSGSTTAASSTLTLSSGTAGTGSYSVTVTATSNTTPAISKTQTIAWTITAARDFTLAASPTSIGTNLGASSSSTLTVTPLGGFSGTVSFAVSGVPTGATASAPNVMIASGSTSAANSTLTLSSGTASPGTYTLTVTASSASPAITKQQTVAWTISAGNLVENLKDDFVSLDSAGWNVRTTVTGDAASARKGLLSLTPAANSGAAGVFVNSVNTYSLLGSSAVVNALEVVSASGGINCKFMFHKPGTDEFREVIGFWYEGGTLYAYYYSEGVQYSAGSVAYDRDAHAWWRLRHSGTTVYWETSRNRSTWAVLGQVDQSAITFDLSAAVLGFNAKAYGTGNAAPGQAHFTHLNLAAAPIASLTDPFTSLDPARWYVSSNTAGSSVTASGGVLSISPEPASGNGGGRVISMRPYALTGSSIVVKVPQAVSSGTNVNQIFRVGPGPFAWDDAVGFWLEGGRLYTYQEAHGSTTGVGATLTYSPTTHAWWRIRESAGTVYWDTSADSVTWTQRASMLVQGLSFSPAVVSLYISADEWGTGNATPGTAKFSNLNAP